MHLASHDVAQCMPPPEEHAHQPGTCGPTVCLGRLLGSPWDTFALLPFACCIPLTYAYQRHCLALHDATCVHATPEGMALQPGTCRLQVCLGRLLGSSWDS